MTRYSRTALGAIAILGLALGASVAAAHEGMNGMGGMGGMGRHAGMHGDMHGGASAGNQLMTPQERDAQREKMAAAKTPEERQALAAAMRADMAKRAAERGIALPEHTGPHGGMGMQRGRDGEHRH